MLEGVGLLSLYAVVLLLMLPLWVLLAASLYGFLGTPYGQRALQALDGLFPIRGRWLRYVLSGAGALLVPLLITAFGIALDYAWALAIKHLLMIVPGWLQLALFLSLPFLSCWLFARWITRQECTQSR